MRITNKIFNDRFLDNLNSIMNKIDKSVYQLSTGKKNRLSSDAPSDVPSIIHVRASIHNFSRYSENISSSKPKLNAVENNLTDVYELLSQTKELAIKASNITESNESREILADEVNEIMKRIFAISNSRQNGRYIFGGEETLSPPFIINGDQYEYTGNGGEIRQVFSDRMSIAINLTGDTVFQGNIVTGSKKINSSNPLIIPPSAGDIRFTVEDGINTSNVITFPAGSSMTQSQILSTINSALGNVSISASFNSNGYLTFTSNVSDNINIIKITDLSGNSRALVSVAGLSASTYRGVNIFTMLSELESTMRSQNIISISSLLPNIDSAIDQIIRYTGEIGSRSSQINYLEISIEKSQQDATEWLSSLEDVDFTDAVRRMNELENIYKASLMAASKFMNSTLLDFLR